MTRISLEDVSKYYDAGETVANYRLNLDIEDGEFLVFLGPSGCGKTTALRMIAGLEDPSEGEIYFDGEPVTNRSPSDRNVAMVFQNYALYPHMTVRENIAYPLKVRGIDPDERDRRIEDVAELLHIEDLLGKAPAELSGGQRQRTALARAIVREPSVFLLDEPLSNLDAKLRGEMRSELKRIQDELGITTVYVTHNQEEAMSMGDRIAVLNEGTIRQVSEPEELYSRPRTTWVAKFIGSPPMNLIRGTRRDGTIDLGDAGSVTLETTGSGAVSVESEAVEAGSGTVRTGSDPVETGPATAETGPDATDSVSGTVDADGGTGTITLGVRPEDLSISTERPSSANAIRGEVDTVEPLGEYTVVNVAVDGQIVNAKVPSVSVGRGDVVYLTFEDEDAYLYDETGDLLT